MLKNSELRNFIIILAALFLWFGYALDIVTPFIQSNFIISYSVFILVTTFLVMKYVLNLNPFGEFRKFFALALIFLAMDLALFPYLVTKTGLLTDNPGAKMSSDVFLYELIPSSIPPIVKYYLIYPVIIALLLMVSRGLVSKKFFWENLKNA